MNRGDQYFILKDYEAYKEACIKAETFYNNKKAWAKAVIDNIAGSGYFSSDRTIKEYNRDIWHLVPYEVSEDE